ncbi:MAG: Orotidine 5'-phosphate decarboxylase [Marinobacterium sp. xm-d-530]|nr:MAG: Orotidine 5'-phosphate decarboxylase [Marinobacterium sp. xm-d-530]
MSIEDNKRVIVALDYPEADSALAMAKQLDPAVSRVKVGKELFTRCGPDVVDRLHALGFEVFLDLKFHDIPNTVAKACGVAAELGVWMVNVHASGGRRMMEAARDEVEKRSRGPQRTSLIAVTVLTSMERSDLAEMGLDIDPIEQVKRLAALTESSGLDGVVCSAQEAAAIRSQTSDQFQLVTPGIRPAGSVVGDQRRIMTPSEAIAAGSTYLVVGRPITGAENPAAAAVAVQNEVDAALSGS